MTSNPIDYFCQPVANGFCDKVPGSALGPYKPCCINTLVVCISSLALICICIHRILLMLKSHKVRKYQLTSKAYHFVMIFLAGLSTSEPLLRILTENSIYNLDGMPGLPPFELVSLLTQSTAWAFMTILTCMETKVYIYEFQLLVRFGIAYVLVGDAVMINLILPVKYLDNRGVLYLYISGVICQVLFGMLLLFHIPNLDSYPDYLALQEQTESSDAYEALPGECEVCPERRVSILNWLFFEWMTPLLRKGYKQPITENNVWKLDTWDQTDGLYEKFQICWVEESQRSKPSLLRALNQSLGRRFWLGGIYKFGEAVGRFISPVLLNRLLLSMQRGEPTWIGCVYAFFMFAAVVFFLLIEGQFFQCTNRVGFRVRSTLVAAMFRKSLRLSHEAHKNFPSGKIMNMISTDANILQESFSLANIIPMRI